MEDKDVSNQGDKKLIEKLRAKIAALEQENQALRGNNNTENISNTNDQSQENSNSAKNESSSKTLFLTYKKRPGTNDAGKEFEYMMCALYALKLCTKEEIVDFKITTNNAIYGDFDDISLEIQFENETKMFLLQLKHKENEEQYITNQKLISAKSEFTLTKYLESFEKLNVGDVTCLVYTNSPAKLQYDSNFEILYEKSENGEEKFGKTKMKVAVKKPQALEFLNLIRNKRDSKGNDDIFQFDIIEEGTTFLKLKSFCENFFLMTGQDNLEIVKATIKKMLTSLLKVDIYDSFIFFMREWWSGRFVLTKRDVISKLVELAMSPWIQTVSSNNINGKTRLLSKGIMNFDMTIVKNGQNNIINNIWNDTIGKNELRKTVQKFRIQKNQSQESKILWFFDKVPLIVKIDQQNVEQVKHSIKLLECVPEKKKLILVGNAERGEFPKWKVLENLKDLHCLEYIYDKIVCRFRISLQGRRSINLEELIINSQDFLDVIEIDDLLKMTQTKWLKVGNSENSFPQSYIPRKVSAVCVNSADLLDDLQYVKNNVLIINCCAEFKKTLNTEHALVMELDEFLEKEKPDKFENLILLSTDKPCTYNNFESVCNWYNNDHQIHLFQVNDDCCIHLMNFGYNEFFQNSTTLQIEETEILNCFSNQLNVVFAPPGMGKSTLFNVLSKNCPTNLWVINVKLIECNSLLAKQLDEEQLLRNFLQVDDRSEALYTKILKVYLHNQKILILLDGVDELESQNVNLLLDRAKLLSSQGFHVWISSRENWQEKIAQDLRLFTTVNVIELAENEQKLYIEKRLKNKYDSSDIKEIVDATFESSDIANSRQMLGIPLQLYIITENFLTNESLFRILREENIFVLTTMYRFFFEGKRKFHLKKMGMEARPELIGFSFEHHLKRYELPALRNCLDDQTFEKLQLDEGDAQEFLKNTKTSGDKFGIIKYVAAENKAVFFHQTYAEYFASVWFARNLDKVKLLREEWFSEKYENLRLIFDIMLSEQRPLHLAVIYKNIQQFHKNINNCQEDKAGRNALYLACCYGMKYPLPKTSWDGSLDYGNCHLERESEIYIKIVDSLLERCQNVFEEDRLFRINYVHYALNSRCLYVIEACLEHKLLNFEKIDQLLQKYYKFETLAFYASQMNYVYLLKSVLRRVDCNIIFKNYKFNAIRHSSLLCVAIVGSKDDHQVVPRENVESVKEILKAMSSQQIVPRKNIKSRIEIFKELSLQQPGNRSALYPVLFTKNKLCIGERLQTGELLKLAFEFGCYEIMRILLSYQTTYNGDNILHMSVEYGTLNDEVLELSKTIGLDVNQKNQNGETALYLACSKGKQQIVEKLLKFGAEIDIQNGFQEEHVIHITAKLKEENIAIMQMLLDKMNSERKSLVNVPDKDGCCPLFFACERGHVNYFELLRQNGANMNVPDSSGNTILHYAARAWKENEEVINIVLSFCVDINRKNNKGETALHFACAKGIFPNVKLLIDRGSDLNASSDDGNTCLHYAAQCYNENTKTIKFLVDNNLQVNAQNNNSDTTLNIVCKREHFAGSLHNTRILLENDADASIADKAEKTPLHNLLSNTFADRVKCQVITLLLSDKRLDINAVDRDGDTALHLALKRGAKKDIMAVLLENGSNPNIRDKNGRNSLHYLCNHYYENPREKSLECIDTLVNHGVNINEQDNNGRTPLHLLLRGDEETLICVPQNYREVGIDEIVFDGHKMTFRHHKVNEDFLANFLVKSSNVVQQAPLHVTGGRKNWDKIMKLLTSGADTNVMDNKGMTSIHYEAISYFDDAKMIKVLVDYGVDLNTSNKDGKTALHLALENKMYNKVKALIEFGADVNKADNNKENALHYAMKLPPEDDKKFLKLIINYDADTKAHDCNLEKYAVEATSYDYVDNLLQKGFDINTKDVNGASISHYACMRGRLTNVEILLKTGANKYLINNNQQTILHYAAMSSHPEENIMKYLIETGVDIYAKDSNGRNALDVAFQYKCFKALRLLIETNKFFDSTQVPWSTLLYYSAFGGCCHGIQYLIQNCDNISALDCNRDFSLEFLKSDGVLQKKWLLQMTTFVSSVIEECGSGSTFGYEPLKFLEYIKDYIPFSNDVGKLKISESPVNEWIFQIPSDYVRYTRWKMNTDPDRTPDGDIYIPLSNFNR